MGYTTGFLSALGYAVYLLAGNFFGVPPASAMFWISLVSFLVGIPYLWTVRHTLELPSWRICAHAALVVFAFSIQLYGVSRLNIATVSLISRVETSLTVIAAVLFAGESIRRYHLPSFCLCAIGIATIQFGLSEPNIFNNGIFFCLTASISFVIAELFGLQEISRISPLTFTFVRNGLMVLFAAIISQLLDGGVQMIGDYKIAFFLVLAALAGPVLARIFYMYSLTKIQLIQTTILAESEAFFTLLLSLVFLSQLPGIYEFIGGLFVLSSGLVLSILGSQNDIQQSSRGDSLYCSD